MLILTPHYSHLVQNLAVYRLYPLSLPLYPFPLSGASYQFISKPIILAMVHQKIPFVSQKTQSQQYILKYKRGFQNI